MKWSKAILISLLLSFALILGACSEDETIPVVDMSEYPESVQDGTVSVEYYEQVVSFAKFDKDYFALRDKMMSDVVVDPSKLNSSEMIDTFKSGLTDYDEFLNDLELSPTTEIDKEINEIASSIKLNQLIVNELLSSFFVSKDMKLFLGASEKGNLVAEEVKELNSLIAKHIADK